MKLRALLRKMHLASEVIFLGCPGISVEYSLWKFRNSALLQPQLIHLGSPGSRPPQQQERPHNKHTQMGIELGQADKEPGAKNQVFLQNTERIVAKAWDDTWKSLRRGRGHSLRNWRLQSLMKPRASWDWLAVNSKTNHKGLAFFEEKYGSKLRKKYIIFFITLTKIIKGSSVSSWQIRQKLGNS